MSTKKDYVEVTVKLHREVAEWFSLFNTDLAATLEDELVQLCQAQIDNSDTLLTPEALKDRFQLRPVFQKYGLISK